MTQLIYSRLNRRKFITSSAAVLAGLSMYNDSDRKELSVVSDNFEDNITDRNTQLIEFALNDLNDVQSDYADIRISQNRSRIYNTYGIGPYQGESMAVSIRVLIDGYWGFACSPLCKEHEITRLVREATSIARYNSLGPGRHVDLGTPLGEESGTWETPIRIDPFDVHPDEVNDFLNGLKIMMSKYPNVEDPKAETVFIEQQMWFGSTEKRVLHQRRVVTDAHIAFTYKQDNRKIGGMIDTVSRASLGWEHLIDQPLRGLFEEEYENVKFDISLPFKPIDVGRYEVVLDAHSSGNLIGSTVANATILSRIAGYNANDLGTSFIVDPVESQNNFRVASSLLNVTSNRSEAGGAETVKWDAEGVVPTEVSLVSNGMISDYTTSREMEGWFRTQSNDSNSVRVSTGSTDANDATSLPRSTSGNIKVVPGDDDIDFTSMFSQLDNGLAVKRMDTQADFQCLNGRSMDGIFYEVKKGKRVGLFMNASLMFKTPELLKNILAIGGPKSQHRYADITSIPMQLKDCTIVDITRKA